MRTESALLPQSMSPMAWMMFLRACALSSGATASSRSRNTTSAADFAAFSNICGWLPGTASSLRFRRAGACSTVKKLMICPIEEVRRRAPAQDFGLRRFGVEQAVLEDIAHQLVAAVEPHVLDGARHVGLHRGAAHAEDEGDLLVGQPAAHELHHQHLHGREAAGLRVIAVGAELRHDGDRAGRGAAAPQAHRGFERQVHGDPHAALRTFCAVLPISAGVGAMATPTSRSSSTFSEAPSPKAEMMAPAWPILRPLGAERPAT